MKKKIATLILSILFVVFAASFVIVSVRLNANRTVVYDYETDVKSVAGYENVLRVAGGTDFSPFCYLDENGLPCGHDVELVFALGRQLGYRIEITLGDWTEMQEGLLNGTYDILLTADYSDERSQIMGYTRPICLDSYVFFGTDANLNPDDMQVLSNLRIAALGGGGATDNYLVPLGLTENTTFYDTQVDAFQSVANGENDVAIAGYIYGSNIIGNKKLDLIQVGSPLYGTAYYYTYDIDNTNLGSRLNSALAQLEATGIMKTINEKWTTHYQPSLTLTQYLGQNLESFLIAGLMVFVFIIVITQIVSFDIRRRQKSIMETDSLTGLFNMRAFLLHMEAMIQKNKDKRYDLIRFDIDNFKAFNRTQGVKTSDKLLADIGQTLRLKMEKNGFVLLGYLGSDHFALLVERDTYADNPDEVYNNIANIVHDAGPGYMLSIKMGLCHVDEGSDNPSQYCDRTFLALRSAKNNFYKQWAWFDESIQKKLDEEKEITEKMFTALDEGRFVPYYQLQCDYANKKIIGAEALARWIEADGTILSPAKFIPVFEKNGFIYEMDKVIWRSVCESIQKWKAEGIMPPHMSVNISRADIYHSDLVDTLQRIMAEYGVTVDDLHFEITESAYLENSALLIETVNRLKAIGAFVEIDDFGSGYSSLSSLKTVSVDLIKLDMCFLHNNTLTGKDAALLSSLVQIGTSLGLDVIAEGVEKSEQAEFLHSIGCDKMQGYLFSKPVDLNSFESLLRKQ